MQQAAGANTVVFDQATPGADIYELHAVAYAQADGGALRSGQPRRMMGGI